jgi:hypothetical protein
MLTNQQFLRAITPILLSVMLTDPEVLLTLVGNFQLPVGALPLQCRLQIFPRFSEENKLNF